MEIIKLPSVVEKEKKKKRSVNLTKNKNAYVKLKNMMVPNQLKLAEFRKIYHPVLSNVEKEILIKMGLDPWSVEGLKYVGDCKKNGVNLGDTILDEVSNKTLENSK